MASKDRMKRAREVFYGFVDSIEEQQPHLPFVFLGDLVSGAFRCLKDVTYSDDFPEVTWPPDIIDVPFPVHFDHAHRNIRLVDYSDDDLAELSDSMDSTFRDKTLEGFATTCRVDLLAKATFGSAWFIEDGEHNRGCLDPEFSASIEDSLEEATDEERLEVYDKLFARHFFGFECDPNAPEGTFEREGEHVEVIDKWMRFSVVKDERALTLVIVFGVSPCIIDVAEDEAHYPLTTGFFFADENDDVVDISGWTSDEQEELWESLDEVFSKIQRMFWRVRVYSETETTLDDLERVENRLRAVMATQDAAFNDAGMVAKSVVVVRDAKGLDNEASDRQNQRMVLSPLQERIISALDGQCLTADRLAVAAASSRSRLYGGETGGLNELVDRGVVAKRKGGGYYRPDAPPAGMIIDTNQSGN